MFFASAYSDGFIELGPVPNCCWTAGRRTLEHCEPTVQSHFVKRSNCFGPRFCCFFGRGPSGRGLRRPVLNGSSAAGRLLHPQGADAGVSTEDEFRLNGFKLFYKGSNCFLFGK